ncbi:MAG: hypothetical protein L0H12_04305 [Nitrosospira sp.]|nr:hypothetical protein [Nitrosospira sp.]MDN5881027.1 hypothetical protein [Nitrosospira sp.]
MKLWSDFHDLAAPDLPGCPVVAIDMALRQSAIAFAEQSLAWRDSHPDIAVVAGTATYAFVPPAQAVVHAVTHAEFENKEIESHAGESNIRIADWRNRMGTPEYVLGGATSLQLVPMPDVAGTLSLEVALKPSVTATGVDDSIFNEFREAIIHGALARLMLSPKKPYSSAQLSMYHAQQFTIKTAAAGVRVARNYNRAPIQTAILRRK